MEVLIHASAVLCLNRWESEDILCGTVHPWDKRDFEKGSHVLLIAATFPLSQANLLCALCGKFSLELSKKSNENGSFSLALFHSFLLALSFSFSIFSSFLLSFPFSLFFLTLLSHPFLLCGLSWPCHFANFKENFFSLCPLENVAVQLGLRYWCYFEIRTTNALGDKKKRSHEGNMYLFRLSDYWG